MLAYFVHDPKKEGDLIIIPGICCSVRVDAERFESFISPTADFAAWTGDTCELPPEDFGKVIATRDDDGDVCVLDQALWRSRLGSYSG